MGESGLHAAARISNAFEFPKRSMLHEFSAQDVQNNKKHSENLMESKDYEVGMPSKSQA